MNRITKLVASILAVVAVGAAAQGLTNLPVKNAENEALRDRVIALQIRLDSLEAKVDAMSTARMRKATP